MTKLVLIRHGETDWNVEGRYQGQADPPLNNKGMQQAHDLAEKLSDMGIEKIYTSPLLRSAQTAEIIGQVLDVPVEEDARLKEIHQGDWQTRLRGEIQELYPELFRQWEREPWEVTPPKGENLFQVQNRVNSFIDEVVLHHPDETIGIVAHRIPIALVKVRFQGVDANIVRTLQLPNTYYEIIDTDEAEPKEF